MDDVYRWAYPKLSQLVAKFRTFLRDLCGKVHALFLRHLGEKDVSNVEDTLGLRNINVLAGMRPRELYKLHIRT